jgi:hypothetical protein
MNKKNKKQEHLVIVCACNPSTQVSEGGLEIQVQPEL